MLLGVREELGDALAADGTESGSTSPTAPIGTRTRARPSASATRRTSTTATTTCQEQEPGGGVIAQVIARDEPELVRKLILTGTGAAGGKGMNEVVWVAQLDTLRGLLNRQDPKQFLFFTRTANGKREGKAFLARLQERTIDRDTPTSLSSYFAQLKACRRWGKEEPHDLSRIRHPVLLANGDNDRMLPTPNTLDMARRPPNNELVIYPDAGHGGIFQFHEQFVEKAVEFLAK